MMLSLTSRCLTLFAVSALFLCPMIRSRQMEKSKSSQATITASYSNDPNGLGQLLEVMLAAAKQSDTTMLESLIRETEIPDYENWFTTTFGQEKGESWAGPYGKMLQVNEKDFRDLLIRLSQMEGQFSVQKLDSARRYDTLTGPLDEYLADWKKPGAPKGQEAEHIAQFFFIAGRFRWDSTTRFFPFQKPTAGSFVPGKLLKRVPPEYPEQARQKSIQGTVILNVILKKDGSVVVQNVADGDPALSPAAVEAVRQWLYEPSLLNGQPVDIQTRITVVFTLNPPIQPHE